jgi:SAM-dependent methyltransferase
VAYNRWLYRRKKARLLQGLERAGFHPKGCSVLEVATGSGVYVEMWKQLGIGRLAGIDISQNATDHLKGRFPEFSFFKRDLSAPNLVSVVGGDFDLVTAVDMLYHVVDDGDFAVALDNLAQATKPGGLLAIHELLRIPAQVGRRFQPKLDSDSKASWTLIPAQAGQPKVIT